MTFVSPRPADAAAWLRASALFGDLPPETLYSLLSRVQTVDVAAGRDVFLHGTRAELFYGVVSGELELYRPGWGGEERLYQVLNAGDLLAEAAMFVEPSTYPLTARARLASRLHAFPRGALLEVCAASPGLAHRLLSLMATRLYQSINRIEQLSLNNAGQRLVSYLVELHREQHGLWLDLPVSIAALASQLAMTPETLSRLLQKFRQAGLVSGRGRTLVLLDLEALCCHVGLPPPPHGELRTPALLGCCHLAGGTAGVAGLTPPGLSAGRPG